MKKRKVKSYGYYTERISSSKTGLMVSAIFLIIGIVALICGLVYDKESVIRLGITETTMFGFYCIFKIADLCVNIELAKKDNEIEYEE